jgi:hypothetical protein
MRLRATREREPRLVVVSLPGQTLIALACEGLTAAF